MATSRWAIAVAVAALAAAGCGCGHGAPSLRSETASLVFISADGSSITLRRLLEGHRATVLIFWSSECPCVRRYQARVDALLDRYPGGAVRIAGVSSNAGESMATVSRVARERGVRIPIFRDASGRVAEALGARTTPTAAVLDGRGDLRFIGWIDNERLPGDPGREPWLERAVDGLLAGRRFTTRTPIYGCTITRSLFGGANSCCADPR